MNRFENFHKLHDPGFRCRKAGKKSIQKYKDKLPLPLLDEWKENGWCGYAKGLIWIVDPDDFESILGDWVDLSSTSAIAFVRTAFGDLFLWSDGEVYMLTVQDGNLEVITSDIEAFFNTFLCEESVLDKVLKKNIYQGALQRLGPPEPDECYAFVPALPLGGSGTTDTVERVKLREHLNFLSQLVHR
jgi:hypothetical protein